MESKIRSPDSTFRTKCSRNDEQDDPETVQHLGHDGSQVSNTACNSISTSSIPSGGYKDNRFHETTSDIFNLLEQTEIDCDAATNTCACKGNEDGNAQMVELTESACANEASSIDVGNPLNEHRNVTQEENLQHCVGISDKDATISSGKQCEEDRNDKENVSTPVIHRNNMDQQNISHRFGTADFDATLSKSETTHGNESIENIENGRACEGSVRDTRDLAPPLAQCSDAPAATIARNFSGGDECETTSLTSSNVESMSTIPVSDVQKAQSSIAEQEFKRSDPKTSPINAMAKHVPEPLQSDSARSFTDIMNDFCMSASALSDGFLDAPLNQDLMSSLVSMHSEKPSTDSEAVALPEQTDQLAENSSSSVVRNPIDTPTRDYQSLHPVARGAKNESVRVLVRVRPPPAGVSTDLCVTVDPEHHNKLTVSHRIKQRSIRAQFDRVLPAQSTQADVYAALQGTVDALLCGINCTVLAYGQTGSGKTHTMLGKGMEERLSSVRPRATAISAAAGDRKDWGMIPRILHDLFTAIERELADGSVAQVGAVGMCCVHEIPEFA